MSSNLIVQVRDIFLLERIFYSSRMNSDNRQETLYEQKQYMIFSGIFPF